MRVSFKEIRLGPDGRLREKEGIVSVLVADVRKVRGVKVNEEVRVDGLSVTAVGIDGFGWIRVAGTESEVREKLVAAGWAGDEKGGVQ